jgi:hypothetical protein
MNVPHERIVEAFNRLPQPVKEFLAGPDLGIVMQDIAVAQRLHADVAAELTQLATYLLIGAINPQQFREELRRLRIPDAQAASIAQTLNQRLFQPLRTTMQRERGSETPSPSVPPTPPASEAPPPPNLPGAEHERAEAPVTPPPAPQVIPPTTPATPKTRPIVKEYSVDPYREPFDEKET